MYQQFTTQHNSPSVFLPYRDSISPNLNLYPLLGLPRLARFTVDVRSSVLASSDIGSSFAFCIAVDDLSFSDNQVFSFAGSLAINSNLPFILNVVRFESATQPVVVPASNTPGYFRYPILFSSSPGVISFKDAVTIPTNRLGAPSNKVYVGIVVTYCAPVVAHTVIGTLSVNQVDTELTFLQPLK